MLLYKYRNIKNVAFFLDIIVNSRLYAATYESLNDPMEGYFRYNSSRIGSNLLDEIRSMKKEIRIVSLAKTPYDILMWSYYAAGHSGVVVGLELTENDDNTVKPVIYKPNGAYISGASGAEAAVEKLLLTKYTNWEHEEEVRILTKETYVKVRIRELIFGKNSDRQTKSVISKVARKFGINKIRKLKQNDIKEFA